MIAINELSRHRVRQDGERARLGPAWEDNDLIFASTIGTPVEPRNVNRRFAACRDRAGLNWLRPHDLRHACATLLIAQGVEPRVIMSILGHSTILLTMNTYAHVLPEVVRDAADAMDRALDEGNDGGVNLRHPLDVR
jgi:integrase